MIDTLASGAPLLPPMAAADPRPLYRQVVEWVMEAVAAGVLRPGERLPSIRKLAGQLGVSVITVKRAYLELESAGYLRARPGLGSFVAELDRDALRAQALEDLRGELARIVAVASRHGIRPAEIIQLVREIDAGSSPAAPR